MTWALIVAADEPAICFATVAAAEGYLEAVDVCDGVYSAAYSPLGERFDICAANDRVTFTPTGKLEPEKLRQLLLRLFNARGLPANPSDPLVNLVDRCRPDIG